MDTNYDAMPPAIMEHRSTVVPSLRRPAFTEVREALRVPLKLTHRLFTQRVGYPSRSRARLSQLLHPPVHPGVGAAGVAEVKLRGVA